VVRGNQDALPLAAELGAELRRLLGRSLKLRQVSAGGCNGCELDTNVLNTVGWDLGRFGVQFVASPRHADGLLITGAVSKNMKLALQKTYDAIPAPKIVIAVGACAIGGGPFVGHAEVNDGATICCRSICSSRAVRRTPSRSWTASSGCWGEWTAGSPARVRRTSILGGERDHPAAIRGTSPGRRRTAVGCRAGADRSSDV
jgi:Ni,Fe-hydrogenase III small subunit